MAERRTRLGTLYRATLLSEMGVQAAGSRLLDVGGLDGYWLAQQPGEARVVLDLQVDPAFDSLTYCRGDGQRLPFADSTFDQVFALDLLEHVSDERRLLAELVRVTRPGGRIVITTPQKDFRIFPAVLTPWAHRRWGHQRVTGYTEPAIRRLLSEAGVQGCRVEVLAARALRTLYLLTALLWRAHRPFSEALLRWAASYDSRRRPGSRGYLLVEATV